MGRKAGKAQMRLFCAILFDEPFKDALSRTSSALKKMGCEGRFTPRANFHLTLAFIGESSDIAAAQRAVDSCAAAFPAFELKLGGLGSFGDILWQGAEGEHLIPLGEAMAKELRSMGFAIEKRAFRPHITLARRFRQKGALPSPFRSQMTVRAISLMRSDQSGAGMKYTEIYRKELR
ncbi:MAG: RNA 2',3'-cyclic phosphodiesterase [Clostridia bacterium]|nr:RNA 2',3'-cyclic phosphodiesterase [Clostridia bacterium]